MSARQILVVGATGKQGGAVVKAILANPPPFEYTVLVLTRNTSSSSAIALSSKPNVKIVSGSLDDCDAIFETAGGKGSVWGVFCVTIPSFGKKTDGVDGEQRQGCNLIDAAVASGVKHFVFSSVDRGGPGVSDSNPTEIGHFVAKHNVELHLKAKAQNTDMTWTILRPVAFMDNLTPSFFGRMFAAMWANMGNHKLQLVSTKDIGIFAAQAFAGSETDEYKNAAISLAGDELTQAEANEVFFKALGRSMPRAYGFMGTLLQTMIPEVGTMFRWFVDVGYKADINHCKLLNSGMSDFETYLREESGFKR